jgi:hypothetical protein
MYLKASDKGYVNKAIFLDFGRIFVSTLKSKGLIPGEVLLLLDGHYSHLFNWEFMRLMNHNNITVLAIPPHSSHVMQPLDRGPFYSLKRAWNKALHKALRQVGSRKLTKAEWLQVFQPVYQQAISVKNVQGGFRGSGIYPTNRAAITDEQLVPDKTGETVECKSVTTTPK